MCFGLRPVTGFELDGGDTHLPLIDTPASRRRFNMGKEESLGGHEMRMHRIDGRSRVTPEESVEYLLVLIEHGGRPAFMHDRFVPQDGDEIPHRVHDRNQV